jgi:hypothetical protein
MPSDEIPLKVEGGEEFPAKAEARAEGHGPMVEYPSRAWMLAKQDMGTHMNMPSTTCKSFARATIEGTDW